MSEIVRTGREGEDFVLIDLSSGSAQVRSARSARADIVFVIDTTGSMSDKIEGLLRTCERFVELLAKKSVDWRMAIVSFGDLTVPGDKIQATSFMQKVEVIQRTLRAIPRNSGGGNVGESSLEALTKALDLQGYRQGSIRVFVLITDEPALEVNLGVGSVTDRLKTAKTATYVVSPDIGYFRDMARRTGGEWFLVSSASDFTGILKMFDSLAAQVTKRIERIQLEADGDVSKFLQLPGADR